MIMIKDSFQRISMAALFLVFFLTGRQTNTNISYSNLEQDLQNGGKYLITSVEGRPFLASTPSRSETIDQATHAGSFDNEHFFKVARPRGMVVDKNGNLLIADFGTGKNDGKIWRIQKQDLDNAGSTNQPVKGSVILDDLPSVNVTTEYRGQSFTSVVGISAVLVDGYNLITIVNRLYGAGGAEVPELKDVPVTNLIRAPYMQTTLRKCMILAGQPASYTTFASLLNFESQTNADGGGTESNPYDMALKDGYIYVSDAAANTIVRIKADTGEMSLYALFEKLPNPLYPQIGEATMDTVPTGIAVGPDNNLYVAYLTGFPFPRRDAGIYKLTDLNGDGDALDNGERTVAVSGLTAAVDVTFDEQGTMYTSEFSLDFNSWGAPGRLCKIRNGECDVTITRFAQAPTSIVVTNGYIYYTQEMIGRVSRIKLTE